MLQHANLTFYWHYYWDENSPKYNANVTIDFGDADPAMKHLVVSAVGTECVQYPDNNPTMKLNAIRTAFTNIEEMKYELETRAARKTQNPNAETKYSKYPKEHIIETLIPYELKTMKFQVQHEFMHMLGCIHEQRHPDANIPWKEDVRKFFYIPKQKTIVNNFDTDSIMLYPDDQYGQHVEEGAEIPESELNYELSKGDIEGIKKLYPICEKRSDIPETWLTSVTVPYSDSHTEDIT